MMTQPNSTPPSDPLAVESMSQIPVDAYVLRVNPGPNVPWPGGPIAIGRRKKPEENETEPMFTIIGQSAALATACMFMMGVWQEPDCGPGSIYLELQHGELYAAVRIT